MAGFRGEAIEAGANLGLELNERRYRREQDALNRQDNELARSIDQKRWDKEFGLRAAEAEQRKRAAENEASLFALKEEGLRNEINRFEKLTPIELEKQRAIASQELSKAQQELARLQEEVATSKAKKYAAGATKLGGYVLQAKADGSYNLTKNKRSLATVNNLLADTDTSFLTDYLPVDEGAEIAPGSVRIHALNDDDVAVVYKDKHGKKYTVPNIPMQQVTDIFVGNAGELPQESIAAGVGATPNTAPGAANAYILAGGGTAGLEAAKNAVREKQVDRGDAVPTGALGVAPMGSVRTASSVLGDNLTTRSYKVADDMFKNVKGIAAGQMTKLTESSGGPGSWLLNNDVKNLRNNVANTTLELINEPGFLEKLRAQKGPNGKPIISTSVASELTEADLRALHAGVVNMFSSDIKGGEALSPRADGMDDAEIESFAENASLGPSLGVREAISYPDIARIKLANLTKGLGKLEFVPDWALQYDIDPLLAAEQSRREKQEYQVQAARERLYAKKQQQRSLRDEAKQSYDEAAAATKNATDRYEAGLRK